MIYKVINKSFLMFQFFPACGYLFLMVLDRILILKFSFFDILYDLIIGLHLFQHNPKLLLELPPLLFACF